MKQETQNKMAEIIAAAQAKAAGKATPTFQPTKPNPAPLPKVETVPDAMPILTPSKMKQVLIQWHEGTGEFDGQVFGTWSALDKALKAIYADHIKDGGMGYTKVKMTITWENGKEITDRIDVGNHPSDFNPNRISLGEYLKPNKSVMYSSNLQVGDRDSLIWEDEQIESTMPELSNYTFADLHADLLSQSEESDSISQAAASEPNIEIVDYSDKAFAVIGETRAIKEELKKLGGKYNPCLKCGKGWIFSKSKYYTVRKALSLI